MGFVEDLGLQTTRTEGGAEVRLEVTEAVLNGLGLVHGGVICSLVDHAIGAAVIFALGHGGRAVTAELKINFLAPAERGVLVARGRLLREGQRLLVGEAEVIDQSGRLIAKALGTWAVVRKAL
ncbi:MAG: esterase [Candidatus Methylomirabilota bacterium]|nr:MAG: esterase [candidate division NC10 bacterium]